MVFGRVLGWFWDGFGRGLGCLGHQNGILGRERKGKEGKGREVIGRDGKRRGQGEMRECRAGFASRGGSFAGP